nr:MAG TPA: hypothetical protein [Bacteriophage sp.]
MYHIIKPLFYTQLIGFSYKLDPEVVRGLNS